VLFNFLAALRPFFDLQKRFPFPPALGGHRVSKSVSDELLGPWESKCGRFFETYQPLKPSFSSSGRSGSLQRRLASTSFLVVGFMIANLPLPTQRRKRK